MMQPCNRCQMVANIEDEMDEIEQEIEERRGYDVLLPQGKLMELERDQATWAARPCECEQEEV